MMMMTTLMKIIVCEVLQNNAALDVFLTNELASLPPSVMRDYYELGEVQNTVLRGECFLILLYVHHLFITQPKNFSRIMKKSNWLTDIMIEKLQTISRGVSLSFADNLKGRGHWEEIEFMRRSFPNGGGRSINVNKPTVKSSILSMRRRNCNEEPATFPTFVLKYDDHDKSKGSRIIKLFSCGDIGIFSNDKPCILLLRNGHFYNVWKYEWLFLNMDNPKIHGKRKSGGASSQRYKKLFHLCCMVSYSNDHLHVCEGHCIRCLSTMDEHLNDDNSDEGDQIACGDCGRAFLQQFCYRVHKQCELNGPYANYCDFLASLLNCDECRNNFSLCIKCSHFGKKRRRFEDKRVFFSNNVSSSGPSKYVKCGYCSDFYIRGMSNSHNCFL